MADPLADLPVYELQPLVSSIHPSSDVEFGFGGRKNRTVVTCAQAYGKDIYVGCSDGSLLRYRLDDGPGGSQYTLSSQQMLPGNQPIDEIALAPSVAKAAVLSANCVHFYTLPSFDPVSPSVIKPVRNVVAFALDQGATSHLEAVGICFAKRTSLSLWALRERLFFVKEVPLPQGATMLRRIGNSIMGADASFYNVVLLSEPPQLLPILPLSQDENIQVGPCITLTEDRTFLLSSFTGSSTLGVFISASGDPAADKPLLEWSQRPLSMSSDGPHILALLPDRTLEIHNVNSPGAETLAQKITVHPSLLPSSLFSPSSRPSSMVSSRGPSPVPTSPVKPGFEATSKDVQALSFCRSGFIVPANRRAQTLQPVRVPLLPPTPTPPDAQHATGLNTDGPSGSGLTPLPSPTHSKHPSLGGSSQQVGGPPSKARQGNALAKVLLVGPHALAALVPCGFLKQAETLLDARRVKDLVELCERVTGRGANASNRTDDLVADVRYIYLKLAFSCLVETQFEDAGEYLWRGECDPRLIIRLFPELRAVLEAKKGQQEAEVVEVEVFKGIEDQARSLLDVNEIISSNLVRNYSPHLRPTDTTASAPSTSELRKMLGTTARDMLAGFLRRWRVARSLQRMTAASEAQAGRGGRGQREMPTLMSAPTIGGVDVEGMDRIVNTTLAILLCYSEQTAPELYALLDETSADETTLALHEVEAPLREAGKFKELSKIYERRGDERKLLEVWTKVADGEWKDEDLSADPTPRVAEVLMRSRDRVLVQKYSLWLMKRDPEAGLKILTTRGSRRGAKSDDGSLLAQIRSVDAAAGTQFLEHMVLVKRNADPIMHTQLLTTYVDQLLEFMKDETVLESFRSTVRDYRSLQPPIPFLSYFALETVDSEAKRVRLKTILFLQGSQFYDAELIHQRLSTLEKVLNLELTVVNGRLGRHRDSLTVLVRDLQDSITAEAYCTLGGKVVPGKVAAAIGEKLGLGSWANLVTSSEAGAKSTPGEDGTKRELLKILMEVYMASGEEKADLTARLLNSQAMNLQVEDVIALVPPTWSLQVIASFLSRSFRRTLHDRHEGQILKSISAGQNLEVAESSWQEFREAGAILQEPAGEYNDSPPGSPSSAQFDEKEKLDFGLGIGAAGDNEIVDIVPGSVSSSLDVRARKEGYDLTRDEGDSEGEGVR